MMPCHLISVAEEVDADDMEAQAEDVPTEEGEGEGELAPQAQVILTGCWLTMKEVSLLMGSLATYAPLPGTCQSWLMHSDCLQAWQASTVCTAIAGRRSQPYRLCVMSQTWYWPVAKASIKYAHVSCSAMCHACSCSRSQEPIQIPSLSRAPCQLCPFHVLCNVTMHRCACVAAMHGSNSSQEHMLEPQQLADMGSSFLHILTTMKHNGAIDKTQAGFTALVQR